MHLTGMHRVNEKNLENLNAAQLKNLMRKGLMARVLPAPAVARELRAAARAQGDAPRSGG